MKHIANDQEMSPFESMVQLNRSERLKCETHPSEGAGRERSKRSHYLSAYLVGISASLVQLYSCLSRHYSMGEIIVIIIIVKEEVTDRQSALHRVV